MRLLAPSAQVALTFLGFLNGGLHRLMTNYWSDRQAAYRSPYSRRDRPSTSEIVGMGTEYRGEDLTEELADVMSAFRPTLPLVPRPEDQHVDHCAAWFFVADALQNVIRVNSGFMPTSSTGIVHYYSWPFDQVDAQRFDPPYGLDGGTSGWLNVTLSAVERERKRIAPHAGTRVTRSCHGFYMSMAPTNCLHGRRARMSCCRCRTARATSSTMRPPP